MPLTKTGKTRGEKACERRQGLETQAKVNMRTTHPSKDGSEQARGAGERTRRDLFQHMDGVNGTVPWRLCAHTVYAHHSTQGHAAVLSPALPLPAVCPWTGFLVSLHPKRKNKHASHPGSRGN